MINKILSLLILIAIVVTLLPAFSHADAAAARRLPPLDISLMGFLEHGTWYFLCEAPINPYRIPPYYATYAPPPPPCGPVPYGPAMPPLAPAKIR
jgi:hypothetical protein